MFNKQRFMADTEAAGPSSPHELELLGRQYDEALMLAETLARAMPSIGILSRGKRLSAFWSVARHIDLLILKEQATAEQGLVAISMMRHASSDYRKACEMFEHLAPRFGINERSSMPKSARLYLAALTGEI